ncbi:hypothetical protein [Alsobacter metallidurans]|nr:hypothetical protein [Alsobacter metallidurans]
MAMSVADAPGLARRARFGLFIRSLWTGFITPSAFALSLILASCIATSGVVLHSVTLQLLAGPYGKFFPRSKNDTEARATISAARLSLTPPAARVRRLCVIANSILAQALAREDEVSAALASATGLTWEASLMTTPLQGPLDEATLADYATRSGPCLVVLGSSFLRFEATPESLLRLHQKNRVGLRSAWADKLVETLGESPPVETGVYAIDNAKFLLRNAGIFSGRALLNRPAYPQIAAYAPTRPLTTGELAKRKELLLRSLARSAEDGHFVVDMLRNTIQNLHTRGSAVILVEEPVSPLLITPDFTRKYDEYLQSAEKLARDLGASYCPLQAIYQPPPESYPDYIHVTDRLSQAKLRRGLAECVRAGINPGGHDEAGFAAGRQ